MKLRSGKKIECGSHIDAFHKPFKRIHTMHLIDKSANGLVMDTYEKREYERTLKKMIRCDRVKIKSIDRKGNLMIECEGDPIIVDANVNRIFSCGWEIFFTYKCD